MKQADTAKQATPLRVGCVCHLIRLIMNARDLLKVFDCAFETVLRRFLFSVLFLFLFDGRSLTITQVAASLFAMVVVSCSSYLRLQCCRPVAILCELRVVAPASQPASAAAVPLAGAFEPTRTLTIARRQMCSDNLLWTLATCCLTHTLFDTPSLCTAIEIG